MLTDLVIDPFGADVGDMVRLAVEAERAGFDGVWTFDHLSAMVADGRWSCDPFVVLGAMAGATDRVRLGVLVANVVNRHPAQLVSAVSSAAMLAPGRVMCGIGSGAAPGSVYAAEQVALGRTIDPAGARRARLVEHIEALRAIWADADAGDGASDAGVTDAGAPDAGAPGEGVTYEGDHVTIRGLTGVVPPGSARPIIVGSSGTATVRVAAEIADGVNIRRGPNLPDLVETVRQQRAGRATPFEISVFERLDAGHRLGGDIDELVALGVDARTLLVSPPFDVAAVRAVGRACREHTDLTR